MKQLFEISWSEGELTPELISGLIRRHFCELAWQQHQIAVGVVGVKEIPLNESEVTQEET